jgi:chromosome segregation ATPase
MNERELLLKDIEDINKQIEVVTRQIDNSDYNITGLIVHKTRHMDRRDVLETRKTELETELASLPDESEEPLE